MITFAIIKNFQDSFGKSLTRAFLKINQKSDSGCCCVFIKIWIFISKYAQMVITSSNFGRFQKKIFKHNFSEKSEAHFVDRIFKMAVYLHKCSLTHSSVACNIILGSFFYLWVYDWFDSMHLFSFFLFFVPFFLLIGCLL